MVNVLNSRGFDFSVKRGSDNYYKETIFHLYIAERLS
jgi:histidyl-tRNA synthetase